VFKNKSTTPPIINKTALIYKMFPIYANVYGYLTKKELCNMDTKHLHII